jgi:acid phosphatase (class A)
LPKRKDGLSIRHCRSAPRQQVPDKKKGMKMTDRAALRRLSGFAMIACAATFTLGSLSYAQDARSGSGAAEPKAAAGQPAAPKIKPSGYLPATEPFDGTTFLPPYPSKGSAAEVYDIATWRESLKGENSPRWKQAVEDDPVGLKAGLTQFQCALGVTLNADNAPNLMRLLGKAQLDTHWAVDRAKAHFKRPRPFAEEPDAPICLAVPKEMRSKVSTAYPGGHSTLGMTWGLILTELAPDRSGQIMSRVRDYSHSRLVCGLHFPSDLEAGHMLGAGLVARLRAEPEFRKDLDLARAEIVRARQGSSAPPAQCRAA